jgi:TRAP-type C4-dicarboxylate transport system permease small subunit
MNTGLRSLARAHDRVILLMAVLSAAIAGGMVVLICLDVGLRNLRLGSLPWSVEASEYGLYAMTLLGAPWVLALRAHVAMDLFANFLPALPRRVLDTLTLSLGGAICAVLAWKGLNVTLTSHGRGAMVYKTLVFPEWWVLALFPFAMTMLALGFLRLLVQRAPMTKVARGH